MEKVDDNSGDQSIVVLSTDCDDGNDESFSHEEKGDDDISDIDDDNDEDYSGDGGSDSSEDSLPGFNEKTFGTLAKFIKLLDKAYSFLYKSNIFPSFFEDGNNSNYHHILYAFFPSNVNDAYNKNRLGRLRNVLFNADFKEKISWGASDDSWRNAKAEQVKILAKRHCDERITKVKEGYAGY
jgi:hypothetical protein